MGRNRITAPMALIALCLGVAALPRAQAGPVIQIVPSPVVVPAGESVQLKANISGPSDYSTKWILQGPLVRDDRTWGSLSEDGLYTAPQAPPPGPIRIVLQVSVGKWQLPVAAASVPVQVTPKPGYAPARELPSPPAPPTPPPFPGQQPTGR